VMADSRSEAEDRFAELRASMDMDAARAWAQSFLGRSETYRATHGDDALDEAARSIGVASGAKVLLGTPREVAEQIIEVHRATGLRGYQMCPLTWSVEELLRYREVFSELERAGIWTPPEKRGWSW
jgi:dimethylsulfone monooxygenase